MVVMWIEMELKRAKGKWYYNDKKTYWSSEIELLRIELGMWKDINGDQENGNTQNAWRCDLWLWHFSTLLDLSLSFHSITSMSANIASFTHSGQVVSVA